MIAFQNTDPCSVYSLLTVAAVESAIENEPNERMIVEIERK